MPKEPSVGVIDHPVHEKVRQPSGFKYGCHSASTGPLKPNGYYAPQRVMRSYGDLEYVAVFIEHRMSTACRNFYLWDVDAACAGCSQPKDMAYALEMRGLK